MVLWTTTPKPQDFVIYSHILSISLNCVCDCLLCSSRSLWLRWCVVPLAMPPAMTDLLDIWAAHSPLAGHALDQITVDFLLPTGIYIQMDVPREATIQHIKLVSEIYPHQLYLKSYVLSSLFLQHVI